MWKKINMKLTRQTKKNIKTVAVFTSLTSFGAMVYALIEHGPNLYPVLNEFIIGFLFGVIASVCEIYIFERRLRRLNFSIILVIKTSFYILICTL